MRAVITSVFNTDAETAWKNVQLSKTMFYICDGLLAFKRHNLPEKFTIDSEAQCDIQFFNKLPGWKHYWKISDINYEGMVIDSEEHGGLVKRWHHIIRINPLSSTQCSYTDEIEIKAGLLTPFVWLWAKLFYRYRQWRWKKLIRLNFNITKQYA